jgi:glycosyltransferase involved in cell wall biosynthesis
MARILYDARWIGQHGIGRFADELAKSLPGLREFRRARRPWHPLDPALLGLELWRAKPKLFFSPGYNSPLAWPKPFVFTLHDLHHLRVRENSNAIKRAYYHQVIRPACHRAAFVLTVSEYSKREIAAWAGLDSGKIVNVGNGVGLPFSPHGSCYQPGFPYLLYVGSHKPHKNLPRLLSAYAAAGVCNDVSFVLTGYPSAELQSQVKALRIQEHVRFLRIADNDSLAQLYRGAAGLLFPSLYEGFGLPPLEAMACGTPVMTSNVCSLPEVVGDAAVLVNPLDIDAIAAGIRKLVMDSELRQLLRSKGLAQARRFTWQQTAHAAQKVLEAALASNGHEV